MNKIIRKRIILSYLTEVFQTLLDCSFDLNSGCVTFWFDSNKDIIYTWNYTDKSSNYTINKFTPSKVFSLTEDEFGLNSTELWKRLKYFTPKRVILWANEYI